MSAPFSRLGRVAVIALVASATSMALVACSSNEAKYRPAPKSTSQPTYTAPSSTQPTWTPPTYTPPPPAPTAPPKVACGGGKCG